MAHFHAYLYSSEEAPNRGTLPYNIHRQANFTYAVREGVVSAFVSLNNSNEVAAHVKPIPLPAIRY